MHRITKPHVRYGSTRRSKPGVSINNVSSRSFACDCVMIPFPGQNKQTDKHVCFPWNLNIHRPGETCSSIGRTFLN